MAKVQKLAKQPESVTEDRDNQSWVAPDRIRPLQAAHAVLVLVAAGIAIAAVWLYIAYRSAGEERIVPGDLILGPMFVLEPIGLLLHGDALRRLRHPELDMVERSDATVGPGYLKTDIQAAARIVAYQTIASALGLTLAFGLAMSWIVVVVVFLSRSPYTAPDHHSPRHALRSEPVAHRSLNSARSASAAISLGA